MSGPARAEPALPDKVLSLHRTLEAAGIAHAFGGALALAYYAQPRVTVDVDLNVFVAPARYGQILGLLEPLGVDRAVSAGAVERDGQGRVWWGRTPVDLFFSHDPIHEAMRERARVVPFGADTLPILAPEHLLVAKVVFDRAKDWLDIEQMLVGVPGLDLDEAYRWLGHLVDPEDRRVAHLRDLVAAVLGR